jgi:hypothetical protein
MLNAYKDADHALAPRLAYDTNTSLLILKFKKTVKDDVYIIDLNLMKTKYTLYNVRMLLKLEKDFAWTMSDTKISKLRLQEYQGPANDEAIAF